MASAWPWPSERTPHVRTRPGYARSTPVSALAEAATARRMLDQATGRLDGKTAAASTARRHRTVLANAMDYAVELGLLDTNLIRTQVDGAQGIRAG